MGADKGGGMNVLRSVVAVLAGLVLISAVVEPLEFVLVALVNGQPTTDPERYFAVRNQPLFLAAKLMYNTVAAVGAGFVTAWLAPSAWVRHGIAMAVLQTVAFGWGLASPELRRTTPEWMWAALIPLTAAGVVLGAVLLERRRIFVGGRPPQLDGVAHAAHVQSVPESRLNTSSIVDHK
jgi:hypothetical protein